MPLADGATFAGYTIVRMLGSGGMGEVYLAQHPRLPRRDALKVLPMAVSADTEFRQRFNREADIAATLWHPHVVGVHDRGDFKGQIWISMDYVDGTDAASPPAIGAQRPELSALDPVLGKALAKDPNDRFERCSDFARALSHRLDATPTGDLGGTSFAPAAPPQKLVRAGVIVPAMLAVLLAAAITVAVMEFRRADRPEAPAATAISPTVTSQAFTPLPPPPVAVIGANCSPVGSTAATADGATAYCSMLQGTGATIWSLTAGDVPEPTVTAAPTDEPLPVAEESPVRVCMQQTGRTRLACRELIRRSNLGLP